MRFTHEKPKYRLDRVLLINLHLHNYTLYCLWLRGIVSATVQTNAKQKLKETRHFRLNKQERRVIGEYRISAFKNAA